MENVEVVPLFQRDIEATHKLFYEILEELHKGDPWALQNYKAQYDGGRMRTVTSESNGSYWTVKNASEEVVGFGFGRVNGGVGFLHWMGVRPDYRKQGVGTKILETMLQDFAFRGCHKAELFTYERNERLQRFYEGRGFKQAARLIQHYYKLDEVHMIRDL